MAMNIDLKNLNMSDIKDQITKLADKKTLTKIGIIVGSIVLFLIIYYAILNPMVKTRKAKLDEKDVYCCGHNTASIDSTCRKLAREGWHVKILKEIGPAPENKKKKAHGHLKSISPGTLVPINNNKLLTNLHLIFLRGVTSGMYHNLFPFGMQIFLKFPC